MPGSHPIQSQLQPIDFDRQLWTATAIHRPLLVLIERHAHIGILLAKDAEAVPGGAHLRAVRWVRLPTGLQRIWLQFRSAFAPATLPDEVLFNIVQLIDQDDGQYAVVDQCKLARRDDRPFPSQSLTARQYRRLLRMSGRQLDQRVRGHFPSHLRPAMRFSLLRLFDWRRLLRATH